MKLSYKKTVLVGLAFLLICAFWQAYDTLVPKILTDKFGLSQTVSGAVMALDNIVALFLLPFFGTLSDRCRSRLGRRTPYVLIGALLAVLLLLPFGLADAIQAKNLEAVSNDSAESLSILWDANPEIKDPKSGDDLPLQSLFADKDEFTSITIYDANGDVSRAHTDYVVPARQAYAKEMTEQSPFALILFMASLMLLLIAMSIFRSPAVALMPDVTPKPLRSKANAVINLMGAVGGILILVLGIIFGTGKPEKALMSYALVFLSVALLMLAALAVFMIWVRERRLVEEMHRDSERLGIKEEDEEKKEKKSTLPLSRAHRISMLLILASVVLWYMGYNAVSSKYSVYAGSVLGLDYNLTLILAQAVSIVAFIPIGILSSRVGRRRMILVGVLMLGASFGVISFLRAGAPLIVVNLLFILGGIGWSTINVNSFPMVVELCHAGDVGKYTGYYYTASMAAQTLTPVLSGLFLDGIGMSALFPYAVVCIALAFVTMLFVRHGDAAQTSAS